MAKIRVIIYDECWDETASPWLRLPFEEVSEDELVYAQEFLVRKWDFEESHGHFFERDFQTVEEKAEEEEEADRIYAELLEEYGDTIDDDDLCTMAWRMVHQSVFSWPD